MMVWLGAVDPRPHKPMPKHCPGQHTRPSFHNPLSIARLVRAPRHRPKAIWRCLLGSLALLLLLVGCGGDGPSRQLAGDPNNQPDPGTDCRLEAFCAPSERCDADTGQCVQAQCGVDDGCALGRSCQEGLCVEDDRADRDGDGLPDGRDNCPELSNPVQTDTDADGAGDECDGDDDGDGVPDGDDNCPLASNPSQSDANGDGLGNHCDLQVPGITVLGMIDGSARPESSPIQAQIYLSSRTRPTGADEEGLFSFNMGLLDAGRFAIAVQWPGFRSETVSFEVPDGVESIDVGTIVMIAGQEPTVTIQAVARLESQEDHSGILVQAIQGRIPLTQSTTDVQGIYGLELRREAHTLRFFKDGFAPDSLSILWDPFDARFEAPGGVALEDYEGVLLRFASVEDADADGYVDPRDNCPSRFNPAQDDADGDGLGDVCDLDRDGDGIINGLDNCPTVVNAPQEDPDGDGLGIACHGGTLDAPLAVGCDMVNQRLNTSARRDTFQGACGGELAGDVVYQLDLAAQQRVRFNVQADHLTALTILDQDRQEVRCVMGERIELLGWVSPEDPDPAALAPGRYLIVVDGIAPGQSGPIRVDVSHLGCRPDFERAQTFDTGVVPYVVRTAELSLDGVPDLVILDSGSEQAPTGAVDIRLGRGDGTFSSAQRLEVGQLPYALAVADITGEGVPDIITANSASDNLSLLVGLGDGTFLPPTTLDVGQAPTDIHVRDLNDDGRVDLITADRRSNTFSVLLGRSGGTFDRAQQYGINGLRLAVEDINADGILDVVAADPQLDTISTSLGLGDGRFAPARQMDAGPGPSAVLVRDLDGDGLVDLLVLNSDTGDFDVWLGTGSGAFLQFTVLPGGPGLFDVLMTDLDKDSRGDIVMTTRPNVGILWGLGQGNYTERRNLSVGIEPLAVTSGDLNADGWTDLVSSNLFVEQARVSLAVPPANLPSGTRAGTRFVDSPWEPCASVVFEANQLGLGGAWWALGPDEPCRVESIRVESAGEGFVPSALVSPLGHRVALTSGGMARLEGHAMGGRWRLLGQGVPQSARLLINVVPDDPLAGSQEGLLPCSGDLDAAERAPGGCRLASEGSAGVLDDPQDVDLLLLEGPFDGGFEAGALLETWVETEPSAGALVVSVVLATLPELELARATTQGPGVWRIGFEVPEVFQGRYLALRVSPAGGVSLPLDYEASWSAAVQP